MKTSISSILVMTAFSLLILQSSAQSNKSLVKDESAGYSANPSYQRGEFVDNDKNGICDNYESRSNIGRGRGFIDKNGDGVCDNAGKQWRKGGGKGYGKHFCKGGGNGYGRGGYQGPGSGYCRRATDVR